MRTALELALMEIASVGMAWEGENDSPTGSFALITINDETRSDPCEDIDANDWLQSTTGEVHYIIQWDSNGQTWVTEHDNAHDASSHLAELTAEYYAWDYQGVDDLAI